MVSGARAARPQSPFTFFTASNIVSGMKHLTAIVHRGEPEEGGYWATCLEVPGANGQGETREDCLKDLADAVRLMMETEREEAFRLDPQAETADLVVA